MRLSLARFVEIATGQTLKWFQKDYLDRYERQNKKMNAPNTCNNCVHWDGRPKGGKPRTIDGYAECGNLGLHGEPLIVEREFYRPMTKEFFGCNQWESVTAITEALDGGAMMTERHDYKGENE